MFVKHYAPAATKSEKTIFSIKVKVKVIELDVIWKGFVRLVCMSSVYPLRFKSYTVFHMRFL